MANTKQHPATRAANDGADILANARSVIRTTRRYQTISSLAFALSLGVAGNALAGAGDETRYSVYDEETRHSAAADAAAVRGAEGRSGPAGAGWAGERWAGEETRYSVQHLARAAQLRHEPAAPSSAAAAPAAFDGETAFSVYELGGQSE